MKALSTLFAALLLATSATAGDAQKYEVKRSVTVDAPAEDVWNVIGDFCDLDDWHPAFTACALKVPEGGGVHRLLTMADGATFLEKLVASEAGLSYTYSIVESPLPLERYVGTLAITRGDMTEITWSSRFRSTDPAMEALVGSVYDGGLAAIQAQFDK